MRDYSATGHPVGSEELASRYHFDLSSATIRNEMKTLEKEGYITQPHTSAGRIPTDVGYRYFVNKLMKHLELTRTEQQRLEAELKKLQKQYLELGRSLTKLLAEHSHGAAFALLSDSVSASGLSKIVEQSTDPEEIKSVARFLDEVGERGKTLIRKESKDVETFIAPNFSLVVSRVRLPSGEKGVIGIVGPKRMKYARNISLLEYISKLLAGGLGIILILSSRT